MERSGSELDLPGFRFHPTEEELLDYYLRRAAQGKKLHLDIIGTLNLYRHDPWDLPGLAKIGEKDWYFFVPRDRKQGNGGRPSRTTERGFWKATGTDRPVRSATDPKRLIGLKKTLVYYLGRAPRGTKTEWVMNEYRLPDDTPTTSSTTSTLMEDIVLCRVYRKAASMKELEQRAAMEEPALSASRVTTMTTTVTETTSGLYSNHENFQIQISFDCEELPVSTVSDGSVDLAELEIPKYELEWGQDPFLTQIRSPWLIEQWSPFTNLLNF